MRIKGTEVEWAAGPYRNKCPWCDGLYPDHKDDCALIRMKMQNILAIRQAAHQVATETEEEVGLECLSCGIPAKNMPYTGEPAVCIRCGDQIEE